MNEVAIIPPKPLTVIERAAAVFAAIPSEEDLRELAKKSLTITEITNEAGKDQCHASRMVLKNTRLEIERVGEEGREDAVQTSKAIIARQKALIGITKPEEERLAAIQKAWDDRIVAEKEAKIQAEIARVAEIQRRLDWMRDRPVKAAGKSSADVLQMIETLDAYQVDESIFQERLDDAKAILEVSRAALRGLHAAALQAEAKAEQLKRDQEELAKLRAAEEERQRIATAERVKQEAADKAKRDAEAKAVADARAAQDAADEANRERNEMALQEIQAIHHQVMIADTGRAPHIKGGTLDGIDILIAQTEVWTITEEKFGALFASAESVRASTLAGLRQKRADLVKRNEQIAEDQRLADQRAEVGRQQEALRVAQLPRPPARKIKHNPGAEALTDVIAQHYNVEPGTANRWLREIDWESVSA